MRLLTLLILLSAGLSLRADNLAEGLAAYRAERYSEAATLFVEALKDGHDPKAAFCVGVCSYTGHGLPADTLRAERLWRHAADAGIPEAELALALLMQRRGDPHSAWVDLLLRASDSGLPQAQYAYARTLVQESPEAMRLYAAAAEGGCLQAVYTLACTARDAKRHTAAAPLYLRLLDARTLPDAVRADVCLTLSGMYRFGRGVAEDTDRANALLRRAADLGNPDAAEVLTWLTTPTLL